MARSRVPARGSAARRSGSCRYPVEHRLQCFRLMPLAEHEERFVAFAVREVTFQNALDRARRILCLHVLVYLATEPRLRAEAAADQHVITVDRVAVLVDGDARGEQSYVADVMLRAGMMAAGQVDVHGRVERDARLAPRGDLLRLLLGMRSR